MKHPWGYLLLSVALHVSAGWLLHSLRAEPATLAGEAPMAIQLVSLAPLEQPQPARPQSQPRPAAAAPTPKPPVAAKPVPAPAKPVPIEVPAAIVKSAPPPRAEPRPSKTVAAPATAPSQPSVSQPAPPTTSVARAPAPAALPAVPVLSLRPSFVSPPPAPRYPSQARRRNQQGIVRVEVRLDERGQQIKLTLVRSSGIESLDQAALEAVTQWRFRPEVVDGRAVPSRVEIPIEFALTANR